LKRLGDRYLDPRQVLTINVVDIDLAGYIDPLRPNAYIIRILRDGTWPRIKVRYSLAQNGRPPRRGEETIASVDYLTNASARFSTDPLRYDARGVVPRPLCRHGSLAPAYVTYRNLRRHPAAAA